MKKVIAAIIICFSSTMIFAQCNMFSQKPNGHFTFDEECAYRIKQQNGFTTKQMGRLIKKSLKEVEKISKRQVKIYGRAKMAEAERYRRKREAENEVRLIVTTIQNEIRQEQNYSQPVVSKKKTSRKYKTPSKPAYVCNHSKAYHKKHGTCASPQ